MGLKSFRIESCTQTCREHFLQATGISHTYFFLMRPALTIIWAKHPRLWGCRLQGCAKAALSHPCLARFLFLRGVRLCPLRCLCCSSERREGHDCQDEPPENQLHRTQPASLGSRAPLLQPLGWQPGVQGDEEDGEFLVAGCSWGWGCRLFLSLLGNLEGKEVEVTLTLGWNMKYPTLDQIGSIYRVQLSYGLGT